jgi:hypothetical protein
MARSGSRKLIYALGAIVIFFFLPVNKANGQTAESLSQVRKVFVENAAGDQSRAFVARLCRPSAILIRMDSFTSNGRKVRPEGIDLRSEFES